MRRKALSVAFISVLLLSLVVAVQSAESSPKTVVVPDNYHVIQEAINAANEGDTIFVKKGTYVENPVVNKSISLVGEDRDSTIIDVTAGLIIESDYVTVTGLTIYDGRIGILLSANYCNISGNKITNATYGISLVHGEKNSITGNIFVSIGLSAAIKLSYSNSNFVESNYVESCTEGIQLREGSSNNMVKGNTIANCQDVAIRLSGSNLGSKWLGPNNNSIMQNNISHSGYGTTIYGANGNIISNNNYVSNTVQFSANEDYYLTFGYNRSVNTIIENFWSDYKGKDANGDGIGDSPCVIDAHNTDYYPLMKSVAIPEFPDGTGETESEEPEPFPTTLVAVAVAVVVAVVSFGLVAYSLRRKGKRSEA